jgi:hypothetical protein
MLKFETIILFLVDISMSLLPVSYDLMRILNIKKKEENRLKDIFCIIKHIYENAVRLAETSIETSYYCSIDNLEIPKENTNASVSYSSEFYKVNITDIISGLQGLFPGCFVEYTLLIKGKDGKMHKLSNIDTEFLRSIGGEMTRDYIVIDWS